MNWRYFRSMNIADHTILTITQVANQVKYTWERDYSNIWIQGEIATCKPYPSGHIYLTLEDGQIIATLLYENLNKIPKVTYGLGVSSNYQNQDLALSKHFNVIG